MQELDIQVGDRVTFENYEGILVTMLICKDTDITIMKETLETRKLIKIERQKYETIEEKKELLTEEEKEFLRCMIKFYKITKIKFDGEDIDLYEENRAVNCLSYPENFKFKNIETGVYYTLSELGLEE